MPILSYVYEVMLQKTEAEIMTQLELQNQARHNKRHLKRSNQVRHAKFQFSIT